MERGGLPAADPAARAAPLYRDVQTQQRHPHYWITVLGLLLYAVIVLLIIAHP